MIALHYRLLLVVADVHAGFIGLLHTVKRKHSRKYFTDNVLPIVKENIEAKLVKLLQDVEF